MFNSLKSAVCLLLFVGVFVSDVFAVDIFTSFAQVAQDTFSSQDIFEWKIVVGDLYKKQLRLAQNNEVVSTNRALKDIVAYYARQSCQVSTKDIFAILSDGVSSFDVVMQQTVWPLSKADVFAALFDEETENPATQSMKVSRSLVTLQRAYTRLFACKQISSPTQEDYSLLQRELSLLYYQFLSSSFLTSTLEQENYWEDLFRNGDPDDSQFDLLVDIQFLWDLFFNVFQATPKVLFYSLPQRSSYQNLQQEALDFEFNSLDPVSSTPYFAPRKPNSLIVSQDGSDSKTTPLSVWASSRNSPLSWSSLLDSDVQHFLSTTNVQWFSSDLDFVLGNQCVSPSSLPLLALADVEDETLSHEEYLSGITMFLDTVSVQKLIDDHLLSGFLSQSSSSLSPWSLLSGNDYANIWFAWSQTTTCEAKCFSLPIDKQYACQADCMKSCVRTCDNLPLDERVLCVNDCVCFATSWPTGAGWKQMEHMFSIKFCTEPVQQVYFQRWKKVSTLEAIFREFSSVLRGLKQSGQTVKFYQSKEFLDGNILSQLKDLLDFKIHANFKPIFPQDSSATLLRARQQDSDKLFQATLGASSTDNYNKYIVLSNVSQYHAELEPTSSYEQSQANLEKYAQLSSTLQSSSQDTVSLYSRQKYSFLTEDVFSFLSSHQQFWEYTFTSLLDIFADASVLEKKIQDSP